MRVVITYQHRGDDEYLKLIGLAFASAKRQGYETVIVGDHHDAADIRIRFPADKEPHLMNWVLAAQLAFIQSSLFDCPSVIFSPDALITKPLESVFKLGFDMGFTVRNNPRWPINNGVIFLKHTRKQKIAAFWRDALEMCKSYPLETQDWYGDQQSLHDIYIQGNHHRLGLHVDLLPCSEFNASPGNEELDAKLIESAYIVHLKGKRKHMMKEYWDMICSV